MPICWRFLALRLVSKGGGRGQNFIPYPLGVLKLRCSETVVTTVRRSRAFG
jgi:hypothetical protein